MTTWPEVDVRDKVVHAHKCKRRGKGKGEDGPKCAEIFRVAVAFNAESREKGQDERGGWYCEIRSLPYADRKPGKSEGEGGDEVEVRFMKTFEVGLREVR